MKQTPITHMLSFDVEEYFQVEAAAAKIDFRDWASFEKRLAPSVDRILDLLARTGTYATFFVLGWVAQNEPDVVRRIAAGGHEIASHGMNHRMIGTLTPEEFRRDILESKNVLEDISGKPILGYRAPTFSITRQTFWALDVVVQAGFKYDSSIYPIRHDRYGIPDSPRFVHRAKGPGGGELFEIPPLTLRLGKMNWPVGGGGYLRLFPAICVTAGLKQAVKNRQPGMLYLHPWEFDPEQPLLSMSRLSRFRHRVGLRRTEPKLKSLLQQFPFSSVQKILNL
jgi:polysaccharide deacetylase family protein (PEP-CTERM system associated)